MEKEKLSPEEIEKRAAETLLGRGVAWPVPAPWWMRILGKKTLKITVKALYLGTNLEISRKYLSMSLTEEKLKDIHKLVSDHTDDICIIAAMAMLNRKLPIKLFSKGLAKYLKWHLTDNMLLEVMIFIVALSSLSSFSNTIRLIGDLKATSPKNLSPEEQGSQQK